MSTDRRDGLAEDRTDFAEDRTVLANERTFAGWMRTSLVAIWTLRID
jgi:putative membrane protein